MRFMVIGKIGGEIQARRDSRLQSSLAWEMMQEQAEAGAMGVRGVKERQEDCRTCKACCKERQLATCDWAPDGKVWSMGQ